MTQSQCQLNIAKFFFIYTPFYRCIIVFTDHRENRHYCLVICHVSCRDPWGVSCFGSWWEWFHLQTRVGHGHALPGLHAQWSGAGHHHAETGYGRWAATSGRTVKRMQRQSMRTCKRAHTQTDTVPLFIKRKMCLTCIACVFVYSFGVCLKHDVLKLAIWYSDVLNYDDVNVKTDKWCQ